MSLTTGVSSPGRIASAKESSVALDVWKLEKIWKRDGAIIATGLELTVVRGTAVWIGGRNGAGKTTLLRILAGLIGADAGYVRAFGLDPFLNRREYQRRVSFLSAGNTGLYARLTLRQQLDTWARVAFVGRSERAGIIQGLLSELALEGLAERRSDRLSLGQRQRLRIALSLIGNPQLLLMDEPRTSLDGEGRSLLENALRRRIDQGTAVIWASPSGDEIDFAFDERYLLADGVLDEL